MNLINDKKGTNKWLIGLGVIALIIFFVVIWYISTYNSLIKLNEDVNNKWSQVETQYQRRVDLIPNLVSTVKGASNFEKTTLEEITKLRSQWQSAAGTDQKIQAANQIESTLSKLLVISENYPELKSNQNFLALQDELANTENKISVERGRYNDAVKAFNTKIKTFPTNIVANNFGYTEKNYFNSVPDAESAPKVDFV